jgi:hypothetical protein
MVTKKYDLLAGHVGPPARFGWATKDGKPPKSIKKNSSSPRLSEAHIQRTCDDFLALDGWRCVKTDLPHLRGLGVSEKGMADRLYIRYEAYGQLFPGTVNAHRAYARAYVDLMWIEWKSKNGTLKPHQQAWHDAERSRGALTLIAGIDFPKTIEGFQAYYRSSGLMRKQI